MNKCINYEKENKYVIELNKFYELIKETNHKKFNMFLNTIDIDGIYNYFGNAVVGIVNGNKWNLIKDSFDKYLFVNRETDECFDLESTLKNIFSKDPNVLFVIEK